MCLASIRLADGTFVACRGCRLCRDNRVNDLVGRCLAEQAHSGQVFAVTLTYAGGGPETAVLRYRDVQLFMKRLRKAGHSVRFICAGEYGTKKGRAHWHIVLFVTGEKPLEVEIGSRFQFEHWPHGYTYFQRPDFGGFRYVLKYALKDQDSDGSSRCLMMSKKPPLGFEFFRRLAHDLVDRRLPIHSPEYAFAHVLDKNGKPRRFWLQNRMREMFIDRYYTVWRLAYGDDPPMTDFLQEFYFDRVHRALLRDKPSLDGRDRAYWQNVRDAEAARREAERREREGVSIGYLIFDGPMGRAIIEVYSNRTAVVHIGEHEPWRIGGTGNGVSVDAQLSRLGLSELSVTQVSAWLREKWAVL